MNYYIIVFQQSDVVDVLTFDDDDARDKQYAAMCERIPFTDVIEEYFVTRIQKLDKVNL